MSVQKTTASTWEVRFRVQGQQKQKTFRNFRAAVSFDEKTKTQLRDGEYVAPSVFTVKEIVEKWLEARKPRWKTQTYLGHKTHNDKYIAPRLGDVKATSLRGVDVELAGAEWEKSVSPKTVNKVFGTLAAAFKFARKLDVKNNPMAEVERRVHRSTPEDMEASALGAIEDRGEDTPEAKAGALRAIKPDEVYSALELKKVIDATAPGLEKALLMTAILTGLRHGELNGLRWSTVNLKSGQLFVNRSLTQLKGGAVLEKPKTRNAYRYVKMAPELVSELRHWKLRCPPSPNGFVFVDELGRPMNRKANNRMLKACCERAEVRALSMNNLRHSFASQHLIAETSALEVSRLMGHSTPDVTLKIYSRWAEREESTAEVALAGRIFGASEPEGQHEVNMT